MKIALNKSIEFEFEFVKLANEDGIFSINKDDIQISETMDVNFKMLDVDLTKAKIEVIDDKISKAEAGIHLLKQAKAELLAIPDMTD